MKRWNYVYNDLMILIYVFFEGFHQTMESGIGLAWTIG